MKANMLTLHWGGVKRSNIVFFSESGHVAYQIKVKEVQTNMQGNTLNLYTPLASGVGLKGQILKLCRCKIFLFN